MHGSPIRFIEAHQDATRRWHARWINAESRMAWRFLDRENVFRGQCPDGFRDAAYSNSYLRIR
jgi:hypothetical protein